MKARRFYALRELGQVNFANKLIRNMAETQIYRQEHAGKRTGNRSGFLRGEFVIALTAVITIAL